MCKHEEWKDPIGGVHLDIGIGWDPFGEYCGPCERETCEGCRRFEISHSKYQVKYAYSRKEKSNED